VALFVNAIEFFSGFFLGIYERKLLIPIAKRLSCLLFCSLAKIGRERRKLLFYILKENRHKRFLRFARCYKLNLRAFLIKK